MKKLKFNFQLEQMKSLLPTVKEFILNTQKKINFFSGQYIKIKFVHENKVLSHAYSIVSTSAEEATLHVKIMDNKKIATTLNTFQKSKEVAIIESVNNLACLDLEVSVL